jgi:hypothetical protein
VGAGVDVGIDPQGTARAEASGLGDGGKLGALLLGFEIELADVGVERADQLVMLLADAREHHVLGGHSRRQRARQLAAGDDVGAEPLALHHAQHGEVRVGLDREGDVLALDARQPVAEHPCVAFERGARIDVDRRADFLGDARERDFFGVELAVAEVEMVHDSAFGR